MTPSIDSHVRLDTHPTHPSAVTAVLTGSQARIALMALEAAGWAVLADNVLVLARIDHEEPYWAEDPANHLSADGITVEITPRLREAMAEEWTWADYPMPWCTRSEIREGRGRHHPRPMLQTVPHHLAAGDAWDTAIGSPVDEKAVAAATTPLTDAGWNTPSTDAGSAG